MNETKRKFKVGHRYVSDDGRELYICSRSSNYIRAEVGLGLPANYKVRIDCLEREWIRAKGHVFTANWGNCEMGKKLSCPCGAAAVLRPASVVHGNRGNGQYLYVCAKYPVCDSYVSAHKRNKKPMGTLADKELRLKRVEAHKALSQLWSDGKMEKWQAYKWLQAKLGLNNDQVHIAMFSFYMCDQVISVCTNT